MISEGID